MARGENTADHPGRKVHRDRFPEGRYEGPIQSVTAGHEDYPYTSADREMHKVLQSETEFHFRRWGVS